MAIKSGIIEVQAFSLIDDEDPKTVVYGKPMSERQRKSVMYFKKGDMVIDTVRLYNHALTANDKGVFIENIYYNGKFLKEVKDKEQAVEILLNIKNLEFTESLKAWLLGMSSLDEVEIKNSVGQSGRS